MSPRNARRRLAGNEAALMEQEIAGQVVSIASVTPGGDTHQGHTARATTLMIQFETSEGRHTSRPYRSLSAAERAVRAAQRRGVTARLTLCDLVEIREITVEPEAVAR